LASPYDECEGVEEDEVEAGKWYLKAAKQGEQFAQYNLVLMYGEGSGVEWDYVKAMDWYRQAAEQDDTEGQDSVGLF
jgi:TPR repeat protein